MHRTIVLVHEDAELKESIRSVLETAGYSVTVAESGTAALEVCRTTLPDMLIIGNMPDMDAFFILQQLQSSRDTEDLRVMWLMPEENDTEVKRAWRAGMDGVANPPSCGEEVACIARYLFDGPDVLATA